MTPLEEFTDEVDRIKHRRIRRALDVERSDPALPARLDDLLDEINAVRNHREESP